MLSFIFIMQLRIFRGVHKEVIQTTLAALTTSDFSNRILSLSTFQKGIKCLGLTFDL